MVALSGGFSREEACRELAKNPGMIASFSRALAVGPSRTAERRGIRPHARHRDRRDLRGVDREGAGLTLDEAEFDPLDFPPPERTEPAKLYLISPQDVGGGFPDRLKAALEPGIASAFQLRVKDVDEHELARLAEPLQRICADADVAFIVNDSMALAKRLGADGVHLGQSDGDIREARALLGPAAQIGKTCHDSRHLAMEAGEAGADYVAFGAFYPTTTKPSHYRPDAVDPELVVDPVRNPLRRDRRDHAGQCQAAGRRRRRLPRRVPGGVGQGRSGRGGARVRRSVLEICARGHWRRDSRSTMPQTHGFGNS